MSAHGVLVAALLVTGCAGAAHSSDPSVRYEIARAAYMDGDVETAAREAKLAIQDDPLAADTHFLLACVLGAKGEHDQATVGFRRAFTLDPACAEAAFNVGTLHLKRAEAVAAASWLETALASDPDHVATYVNLAKAYFLADLPELAIAAYEEALRRDPDHAGARANLIRLRTALELDETSASPRERASSVSGFPAAEQDGAGSAPGDALARESPPPPPSDLDLLRELVHDLRHVSVETRAGRLTLTGWTRDAVERAQLDRILAGAPGVLDLTTGDSGDSQSMIEVDATIFIVIGVDSSSEGFNFLRLINITYDYFDTDHRRDGTGFSAPDTIGSVTSSSQAGWIFTASVDYDVNIANATDERVAVLARPHLTTLSGTPAEFLAGGEIVFRVAGNISGDIKPYPFGTSLIVVPTVMRTRADDGGRRMHLKVEAERSSILDLVTQSQAGLEDSTIFDKVNIRAEAVLDTNQTLILSGLSQKDRRTSLSGVPVLRSIPGVRYFFSETTSIEVDTSVIILLTPRDPAYQDERHQQMLDDFVEMRRAFLAARRGSDEDFERFAERYPGWRSIAPNRFASHFFLVENSELYRAVSGSDLIEEDLELDLLGTPPAP